MHLKAFGFVCVRACARLRALACVHVCACVCARAHARVRVAAQGPLIGCEWVLCECEWAAACICNLQKFSDDLMYVLE